MQRSSLTIGIALWAAGTLAIRVAGHYLLQLGHAPRTLLLYAISFALMVWVARQIFGALRLDPTAWPSAATLLMLPTLVLDSLGCLFFPALYPNVDPAAAGLFGGWMLMCCAGAATGARIHPRRSPA